MKLPQTKTIIFAILLLHTFAAALTNTASDIDIVTRALVSLMVGHYTGGKLAREPETVKLCGYVALVSLCMMICIRWTTGAVNGNVLTLREVVFGCVGVLMGKENKPS